jgi:AraC-like DNA-binding protein
LTDLHREDRTISQIAFACGFGAPSYFNRTFKRLYGATPSDIRSAIDRQEI